MSDLNIKKESDSSSIDNDPTQDTAPAELAAVVDDLLNQLSTKFSNISSDLISKMDDMSRRLDSLEAAIQSDTTATKEEDAQ